MHLLNCIEHNATDLQTPEVESVLKDFQHFLEFNRMSASYEYESKGFKIVSEGPFN